MKILVVLPRFPYPLEKGDKLRAYYQIVELHKLGHKIYLFAVSHIKVSPEYIEALRPFCEEIKVVHINWFVCRLNIVRSWFKSRSLQLGYWTTERTRIAFRNFEKRVHPDVLYNQMVRTMPLVTHSRTPKVMDLQDALSMNTERRMEQSHGIWHYILHYEFKMLRSCEYNAFSKFDALTIIGEPDSEAIPHKKNGEIKIIPNGVDFNFFTTKFRCSDSSVASDIVFCGNMSYAPNVNAAHYLVEQVMPIVWRILPSTKLLLAGASPKHSVSRLDCDERVKVSGYLPDIRDAYAGAKIFVAPMQIGSGLQNKLLEAMAMCKPCITTSLANASLGAKVDEELLIGDNPEDFAAHIIVLLSDPIRAAAIAENGHRFVKAGYSWSASVQKLAALLNEVAKKNNGANQKN